MHFCELKRFRFSVAQVRNSDLEAPFDTSGGRDASEYVFREMLHIILYNLHFI